MSCQSNPETYAIVIRHVGRPRKLGPRKGSKRVKTHFEPTPAPVEQPETPQA